MFAIGFHQPGVKLIVDDCIHMTAKQIVDVESYSVLLLVYDSISYTQVVRIEFKTDTFKVGAEFVVP